MRKLIMDWSNGAKTLDFSCILLMTHSIHVDVDVTIVYFPSSLGI